MLKQHLTIAFLLLLPLAATAQRMEGTSAAQKSTTRNDDTPAFSDREPRYRIRSGDSFGLDLSYSPEFNQEDITVQPDGFISLSGVGSVYVQGQTLPQMTETIRTAYGRILRDPVIVISLKDFEKPYFIAAGQVGKPGKYDLRSDITVTDAVALAGGFTENSKHSQVVVFHHVSGNLVESHILNVKEMLNRRNMAEDIHLQAGDMVYVPQNVISKLKRFLPASSLSMYLSPTQF